MAANVYDDVPYSNYPYAQTHPDRLATVAILHGLEPPDPFQARVLELGCGAGGNLLAMAGGTPGPRAARGAPGWPGRPPRGVCARSAPPPRRSRSRPAGRRLRRSAWATSSCA